MEETRVMDDKQAALLLRGQDNFLILTHRQPDGDTIGCAAGLCLGLRRLGKTACVAPNEGAHSLLAGYLDGCVAPADFTPGYIVAVDTASVGLFPQSMRRYANSVDLALDHHPSNEGFGKITYVDSTCAACGELIYRILTHLGPVEADAALPLYVAIATDTGCFAYGNTSPETHRIAADLMAKGIDAAGVNKRHFRTRSLRRLRLEAMLVEGLVTYEDGSLAVAALTLDMVDRLGPGGEEDLDDIAAFTSQIEGVKTAVTLREMKPGECKISLRTDRGLNASTVCGVLGGGGHAAAAGCTVAGTVDEARDAILEAIRTVRNG